MNRREETLRAQGFFAIAGVDEAGRGPLAGPVVAAAVVLPPRPIVGLNDSKRLSPATRERLYEVITREADVGVGVVDVDVIEAINILNATKAAMTKALQALKGYDYVLIDALTLPLTCPCDAVIHGDAEINAIAAASIVAKVTRDRLMVELDRAYPGYGLAVHKGYGTKAHCEAIIRLGPSPVHRASFLRRVLDRGVGL